MNHWLHDDFASYTDLYQLTMAQGHFLEGRAETPASFDYFFRKNPFGSGFVIFAGLGELLPLLEGFQFSDAALSYLRQQGFQSTFLDYLREFRFQGTLFAPDEGEVVFPLEPLIRVEGTILEAQIIETALLNLVNFSSLIATKAARMRHVAGDRTLMDFGLRRAPGLGAMQASRAAFIGGFDATSNVLAGQRYNIPISGTQAHAWIQSFPDELSAFQAYARHYPDSTVLLVDTYDTLRSGIPNAITVARELRAQGHELVGVRLDSGDLAYLARQARQMFDAAGFPDVKIAASNQLDEHVIKSLLGEQDAPIDLFGVGTQLVTAYDDPALDGVYKLSSFDGEPRLKLSETYKKVNFPGLKMVHRLLTPDGHFFGDAITLDTETTIERMHHPEDPLKEVHVGDLESFPLLNLVMKGGKATRTFSAAQARQKAQASLQLLLPEHQRFDNPHIYKVGLSTALKELRNSTLKELRSRHRSRE